MVVLSTNQVILAVTNGSPTFPTNVLTLGSINLLSAYLANQVCSKKVNMWFESKVEPHALYYWLVSGRFCSGYFMFIVNEAFKS